MIMAIVLEIAAFFVNSLDSVINALLNFIFKFTLRSNSLLILLGEIHPLKRNYVHCCTRYQRLTLLPKISLPLLTKDVVLLTRIMKSLLSMEANINIILVQVSIVSLNKVRIVIKVHIYLDPSTQGNAGQDNATCMTL